MKSFAGARVRSLRRSQGLRLEACALRLGISASYLSQIESNQRPVTDRVLVALLDEFGVSAAEFEAEHDQLLLADLREAAVATGSGVDPVPLSELRVVATQAPHLARRFLDIYRDNHRLLERLLLADEAVGVDGGDARGAALPYEEVRDYFHFKDNYIGALDVAAEALAEELGLGRGPEPTPILEAALRRRYAVTHGDDAHEDILRRFDPHTRTLSVNPSLPRATRAFHLAFQLAALAFEDLIDEELHLARFRSPEAADVCRVGLGNYAAGALLMPYGRFATAARTRRHDVEQLASQFGVSLEQICHRLSTLQRPGARGVPLYFLRLDRAGNITKRHSATRFHFARFGGACPLWNVHEAAASPGRFLVQLAEMPDGVRYLCVALGLVKSAGAYLQPDRHYVLGFGCEISHAQELVYAAGVDLRGPAQPIGVSCRICERAACPHRAFPPVDQGLSVPRHERRTVPFSLRRTDDAAR